MKKIRVYIASPYTNGWQADNVRRQLEAKHILLDNNFVPFAPLENHFSEIYRHRAEGEWFNWDLEWLSVCHILVRIKVTDNENNEVVSTGADKEVVVAKNLGIPVYEFSSLTSLQCWCETIKKEELWKEIENNDPIFKIYE